MVNIKKTLTAIIVWQVIVILFALYVIIWRAYYSSSLFSNPFVYHTFDEIIDDTMLFELPWYPEYYQTFHNIEWPLMNILLIILVIVLSVSCIGFLTKKNWGRKLSIVSMILVIIFFVFTIISVSVAPEATNSSEILNEVIAPMLISQVAIFLSSFALVYLNKPYVKEVFKRESAQA